MAAGRQKMAFVKGAPKEVLALCCFILDRRRSSPMSRDLADEVV